MAGKESDIPMLSCLGRDSPAHTDIPQQLSSDLLTPLCTLIPNTLTGLLSLTAHFIQIIAAQCQCFLGHNPDIHPLTHPTTTVDKDVWALLRLTLQAGLWLLWSGVEVGLMP